MAPVLVWLFIGLFVGSVMGLTGAGGALISIPLMIHVLEVPFKDATVYSLVFITSGALLNVFLQRKSVDRYALRWILLGVVPSVLFAAWTKTFFDETILRALMVIACVMSLSDTLRGVPHLKASLKSVPPKMGLIGTGVGLGFLVTWTGLGGGILMIPILTRRFRFSYARAVPTSLVLSALGASYSLVTQLLIPKNQITLDPLLLWTLVGLVLGSSIVRQLLIRVDSVAMETARRRVFITLLLGAIVAILI